MSAHTSSNPSVGSATNNQPNETPSLFHTIPALDQNLIRRFLQILHQPGAAWEIRVPGTDQGTVSGYYNDVERAVYDIVHSIDPVYTPSGIYVTVNSVDDDLFLLRSNRFETYARNATTKEDVQCRRWLFLDIDSDRKAGISATEEELQAAIDLANRIRNHLAGLGWPEPVQCCSGNGAYLLYRIDLPNSEEMTALVQKVLRNLASRFNTTKATVDTKTSDACRTMKVIGTWARKGDERRNVAGKPDRIWRLSTLEHVPEEIQIVSEELLRAFADEGDRPAEAEQSPPSRGQCHGRGGIDAAAQDADRAADAITVDQLWREIAKLPDAISGQGGHAATYRAACECYRWGATDEVALQVMQRFSREKTGGQPWKDDELRHKITDARARVEQDGQIGIRRNRLSILDPENRLFRPQRARG